MKYKNCILLLLQYFKLPHYVMNKGLFYLKLVKAVKVTLKIMCVLSLFNNKTIYII